MNVVGGIEQEHTVNHALCGHAGNAVQRKCGVPPRTIRGAVDAAEKSVPTRKRSSGVRETWVRAGGVVYAAQRVKMAGVFAFLQSRTSAYARQKRRAGRRVALVEGARHASEFQQDCLFEHHHHRRDESGREHGQERVRQKADRKPCARKEL